MGATMARLTGRRGEAAGDREGAAASSMATTLERRLGVVDGVLARIPGLPNTCLYRALGRYAAYRRLGVDVRFVMGLRRPGPSPTDPDAGALDGHAWLELDGRPFAEILEADYVKTFEYPSGAASS
jgi:hypothetical protein